MTSIRLEFKINSYSPVLRALSLQKDPDSKPVLGVGEWRILRPQFLLQNGTMCIPHWAAAKME